MKREERRDLLAGKQDCQVRESCYKCERAHTYVRPCLLKLASLGKPSPGSRQEEQQLHPRDHSSGTRHRETLVTVRPADDPTVVEVVARVVRPSVT